MSDDTNKTTGWDRLMVWLRPRIVLSLWGDGNGICGAGAGVRWLGREWLYREHEGLYREHEERPQHD